MFSCYCVITYCCQMLKIIPLKTVNSPPSTINKYYVIMVYFGLPSFGLHTANSIVFAMCFKLISTEITSEHKIHVLLIWNLGKIIWTQQIIILEICCIQFQLLLLVWYNKIYYKSLCIKLILLTKLEKVY